jgi:dethiobiotin synthetase
MSGYFVTGTDTGVGKTFVTAALARRARTLGRRVFAFKPIETGCQHAEGRLIGADQAELWRAAGGWQEGALQGLYQFAAPLAPLMAAEAEGRTIDLPSIVATFQSGSRSADLALVEGAGGWRVPLTSSDDISALARRLELPVIVVARATLGTINHSLLTLEAVERDGCRVACLVLSRQPADDRELAAGNVAQIRRRWPGLVLMLETDDRILDPLL